MDGKDVEVIVGLGEGVGVTVLVGVGVREGVKVGVSVGVGVKVFVTVGVTVPKNPICGNMTGMSIEESNNAMTRAKPPMNQRPPPDFLGLTGAICPVFNKTK